MREIDAFGQGRTWLSLLENSENLLLVLKTELQTSKTNEAYSIHFIKSMYISFYYDILIDILLLQKIKTIDLLSYVIRLLNFSISFKTASHCSGHNLNVFYL